MNDQKSRVKIKIDPLFQKYRRINSRLLDNGTVYFDDKTADNRNLYLFGKRAGAKRLRVPRIAVYTGTGASHSWLWYVDILENMGFSSIKFISEDDIEPDIANCDSLLVSGGETFALAHGLGERGRNAITNFIDRGGLYFGSCAGACMMMRSTTEPLGLFDLVNIKIANIADELPDQIKPSNKYSTPYGCAFVFHPVREEVILESSAHPPLFIQGKFTAPLYGGPPMEESDEVTVLARYAGFTQKTDFLASVEKAEEILIGKTAVCMKRHGNGHIILSGPHMEHPSFPEANTAVADAVFFGLPDECDLRPVELKYNTLKKGLITDLKRELSNIRIIAFGLEHSSISWLVGRKYYEPEKIRTYVESLWQRLLVLEHGFDKLEFSADFQNFENVINYSKNVLAVIRHLKSKVDGNEKSDDAASDLFVELRRLSKEFLTFYFSKRAVSGS